MVSLHTLRMAGFLAWARRKNPLGPDVDLVLLAPMLTLCVFGLLAVFWAGLSPQFSSPFILLKEKVRFILPGIGLMLCFSKIDYHFYENRGLQVAISLAVIVFLALLFFLGPKEFGARLRFLVFNKTIQPTEYVKVIMVIVLSYTITETYRKDLPGYFIFSIHSLLLAILFVLIALQPDFGAVLILLATALCMLIVARIQVRRGLFILASVLISVGVTLLALCFVLAEDFYGLERLKAFLECFFVKGCKEYQLINAYHVIISGGLFGNSIRDVLHPHGIVPMESNDFIFCVVAEETGFLGVVFLLLIYLRFIQRGFFICKHCKDFFGQSMAFGLTWIIGFQALLNILVATGLLPTTGVTLPFISHGGNSLLSAMIAVGILLNISKNTNQI
ncbi:MAG: FtsW/RodA/SpoVE family cell cycle protein [Deltaproteobacteria bacterium]